MGEASVDEHTAVEEDTPLSCLAPEGRHALLGGERSLRSHPRSAGDGSHSPWPARGGGDLPRGARSSPRARRLSSSSSRSKYFCQVRLSSRAGTGLRLSRSHSLCLSSDIIERRGEKARRRKAGGSSRGSAGRGRVLGSSSVPLSVSCYRSAGSCAARHCIR